MDSQLSVTQSIDHLMSVSKGQLQLYRIINCEGRFLTFEFGRQLHLYIVFKLESIDPLGLVLIETDIDN